MKKKVFNQKLNLKKETVVSLSNSQMNGVNGGNAPKDSLINGRESQCDICASICHKPGYVCAYSITFDYTCGCTAYDPC